MPTPLHDRHPRPLLARADWQELDGQWQFAYDDSDTGIADGWPSRTDVFDRTITVPYPPESPASGIHDTGYHPVLWYRRTLTRALPRHGNRLMLRFGAVDYRADVWVNGRHIARHEGGHTPFGADITDALSGDGEQTVVVRAWDDPHDLEQPRGKQDWQHSPHVIWYERTTGIWQPVWLEELPADHVDRLRWTPTGTPGEVDLELRLARRSSGPVRVTVRLELADRVLAEDTCLVDGSLMRRRIAVQDSRYDAEPHHLQWSPEHPTLCRATVTLEGDGDAPRDVVHSYVGFRTAGTDADNFLLNNLPYYLRMVLSQGYWPQSHLAAPDTAALRTEVETIKRLGFNGIRVHQKVEDPRLLYWCDRLGLLVWADAAASYSFSSTSLARTTREWIEIVDRDAGHPCVVAWVAFNESWGVPDVDRSAAQQDAVRGLYHLLKSLDPTRPVLGNDGWEYVAGDLLGVHDYTHDPAAVRERYADREAVRRTAHSGRPGGRRLVVGDEVPAVPVVLSEFGGFTYAPGEPGTWDGYGTAGSAGELLERLAALMRAVHESAGLAGYCFTQLTDTGQERNGLLTEDRRPKADIDSVARIMRGRSAG
ncbi:sugar-binding domain-containing protein [Streptomyces sp. NBC_01477]|uniref:sugar-binding domain-containing protein n=1 Tax=Streptomyces sp. NBC_01477 TaxID=2976015 RepID=UPI002E3113B5|nr:sugar-binding domain-containing protein [Streptomyces sp. NBC_01477]